MNVGRRLEEMRERLERVKLFREVEPEPDGLSLSLWTFGAELAALDDVEIADLAKEWEIAPDNVREMARAYAR